MKETKIIRNTNRLTLRLDSYTKLKLDELVESLDVTYSVLIRSMIIDFLNNNEQHLNNIIDKNKNDECHS